MRPNITSREVAVRLVQAVILYFVGGIVLYQSMFLDSLDDYETIPVWWWVDTVVSWPTDVTPTGVVAIVAVVLVLFGLTKAALWLISRFRTTLSRVPSRRAFLGFMLLSATLGMGAGMVTEPFAATEHRQCQDLPDSAFVMFEGVYEQPDGDLLYFAGGPKMWMYETDSSYGDWYVYDKNSGYGRSGYAYEGTYEEGGQTYYLIANDSSLTFYEKNRTAIGTQGATVKSQFDFVAKCTGNTDV